MVCFETVTSILAVYAALCSGSLTKKMACADQERRKDTNDFWDLHNYLTNEINAGEAQITDLKKQLEAKDDDLKNAKRLADTNRKLANKSSRDAYAAEDQMKTQSFFQLKYNSVNHAYGKVTANLTAERESHMTTKAGHVKELEAQEQRHISAIKDLETKLRKEQEAHEATKQQKETDLIAATKAQEDLRRQAEAAAEGEFAQAYTKAYRDLLAIRAIHGQCFEDLQADCEAKTEEIAKLKQQLRARHQNRRAKAIDETSGVKFETKSTQICPNCGTEFGAQVSGSQKSPSKPAVGAPQPPAGTSAGGEKAVDAETAGDAKTGSSPKENGDAEQTEVVLTAKSLSGFTIKLPALPKKPAVVQNPQEAKKDDDAQTEPVSRISRMYLEMVEDQEKNEDEQEDEIPKEDETEEAAAPAEDVFDAPEDNGDFIFKPSSAQVMHGCPIHREGRKSKLLGNTMTDADEAKEPCCIALIADDKVRQGSPHSSLKKKRSHEDLEYTTPVPAWHNLEEDAPHPPSPWTDRTHWANQGDEKRPCGVYKAMRTRGRPGAAALRRSVQA